MSRGRVILVDFILNTFIFISVYLRLNFLPAALTRYFPVGTAQPMNPRGGVDQYISERDGMEWTVRKLHKASDKPASILGSSTPDVALKESPPHR